MNHELQFLSHLVFKWNSHSSRYIFQAAFTGACIFEAKRFAVDYSCMFKCRYKIVELSIEGSSSILGIWENGEQLQEALFIE